MPAPADARAKEDTNNYTKAVGPQLRSVQERSEPNDDCRRRDENGLGPSASRGSARHRYHEFYYSLIYGNRRRMARSRALPIANRPSIGARGRGRVPLHT